MPAKVRGWLVLISLALTACTSGGFRALTGLAMDTTFVPVSLPLDSEIYSRDTTVTSEDGTDLMVLSREAPLSALSEDIREAGFLMFTSQAAFGQQTEGSADAFSAFPPEDDTDHMEISIGNINRLDTSSVWWVRFAAGLPVSADPSARIRLTVGAVADKLDPTDASSVTFYEEVLNPGETYQISVPMGIWTRRSHFRLVLTVQREGESDTSSPLIIDHLRLESTQRMPESSLNKAGIAWTSSAVRSNVLRVFDQLPKTTWYRDLFNVSSSALNTAYAFSLVQGRGKKILALIVPMDEDFDDPAAAYANQTAEFKAMCGATGSYRLSMLNTTRLKNRLRNNLIALKSAGVDMPAFEIGNEIDWVCSNGDLVLNTQIKDADYIFHARAYARFLEASEQVIHEYYPRAVIVSWGMSQFNSWTQTSCIPRPGRILNMLKNLDGKNYFALIDKIGVHYYPDPRDQDSNHEVYSSMAEQLGEPRKPFWVTEWGFTTTFFASSNDRYRAFVQFYDQSLRAPNVVVENLFNYGIDDFELHYNIVDPQFELLPESRFFNQYF